MNIVPAVCGGDHEFLADGDEVRDAALDVNLEGEREDERRDELLEEELVRLPLHAGPRGGGVDLLVEGLDVGGNDDVVDDQVALRGLNGNENESDVERLHEKLQNSYHDADHGRVRPPLREHVLAQLLDRLRRSPMADDGDAGLHVPEVWDCRMNSRE